jgi:ankyrin repeat protein
MKHRHSRILLSSVLAVALLSGGCGRWVSEAHRQYALNRELIAALDRKDIGQALTLVNAGADPNTRYNPPPSPTLKLLLSHLLHRSPAPAEDRFTAFLLADATECYSSSLSSTTSGSPLNEVPLIRAMLAHGANIDQQDFGGNTLLMFAALRGDAGLTELLVEHGANAAVENTQGDTALHYALCNRVDTSILRLLLAHGADPTHPNQAGETPLTIAQKNKRPDIVTLLQKGEK